MHTKHTHTRTHTYTHAQCTHPDEQASDSLSDLLCFELHILGDGGECVGDEPEAETLAELEPFGYGARVVPSVPSALILPVRHPPGSSPSNCGAVTSHSDCGAVASPSFRLGVQARDRDIVVTATYEHCEIMCHKALFTLNICICVFLRSLPSNVNTVICYH